VPGLAALKAGVFPLAVIHNRTLVVEFIPGVSFLLGLASDSWRCRGLEVGLPGALLGRSFLLVILTWLKLPLVGVIDGAVFLLRNECGVDQGLEVRKLQYTELCLEGLVHSVKETVLLLFVCVDIFRGIAGKVVELSQIFADAEVALGKGQKFLLLDLDNAGGDVCLAVNFLEFLPSEGWFITSHVPLVVPPNAGRAFEVVGGKRHLVLVIHASDFQLLVHCPKPIISLKWVTGR